MTTLREALLGERSLARFEDWRDHVVAWNIRDYVNEQLVCPRCGCPRLDHGLHSRLFTRRVFLKCPKTEPGFWIAHSTWVGRQVATWAAALHAVETAKALERRSRA